MLQAEAKVWNVESLSWVYPWCPVDQVFEYYGKVNSCRGYFMDVSFSNLLKYSMDMFWRFQCFLVVKLLRYSKSFRFWFFLQYQWPTVEDGHLETKSFPLPAKDGHAKLKLPHRRRREYTTQLVLMCSDVLLMEGILHHLGCINPVNDGMDYLRSIKTHDVFGFLRWWQDSSDPCPQEPLKGCRALRWLPYRRRWDQVQGSSENNCWNMSFSKNPRLCYAKGTKMYQGNEAQLVAVLLFRSKDSDHMNHMKHLQSLPRTNTIYFWTSLVSLFFFVEHAP